MRGAQGGAVTDDQCIDKIVDNMHLTPGEAEDLRENLRDLIEHLKESVLETVVKRLSGEAEFCTHGITLGNCQSCYEDLG